MIDPDPAIPVLETARLRLRGHRHDDLDAMCTLWRHPETIRFIGGKPQDQQAVWFRLLRYVGMWHVLGYGFWAIEDRATGAFLGDAGLMQAERGLAGLRDLPEAGWGLMPDAAGKGFATEALRAIFDWADAHLDLPRTACIIAPQNVASMKVATKLGFAEIDRPLLNGEPVALLYRERRAQAARIAASS